MSRPVVKVCGITTASDARLAVDAGADFLGLNFFHGSPRCIDVGRAIEIAAAVSGEVQLVGVFVNEAPSKVGRIADTVGLDLLQFHGDEPVAAVAPFAARSIRALRVGPDHPEVDLEEWRDCWALLIDSHDPKAYGGTGHQWAAELLPPAVRRGRFFVAGGLTPSTVAARVAALHPWGVDVCSGVESSPGRKDPELLRRFFEEVRDVQAAFPS